jgi:hypothetical protein
MKVYHFNVVSPHAGLKDKAHPLESKAHSFLGYDQQENCYSEK